MKGYRWHLGSATKTGHCQACAEKDGQIFLGEFPANEAGAMHDNCTCWGEPVEVEYDASGKLVVTTPNQTEPKRDVQLQKGSSRGPKLCFVAASPSSNDALRGAALTGEAGLAFKRAILGPLGLEKAEVGITYLVPRHLQARGRSRPPRMDEILAARPGLEADLRAIDPQIVITLGQQAGEVLGTWADFRLPHPEALGKAIVSNEVNRKIRQIKLAMVLQKPKKGIYLQKSWLLPERRATLIKAAPKDEEKRLVYAIVLEPDTPDGEGDVFSAEMIEQIAHQYTSGLRRQFQNWHSGEVVEAELYESEIAKTTYQFGGQTVKQGSWVICSHVVSDKIWALVKSGIYQGISVGGRYIHVIKGTVPSNASMGG